jgi:hypothetical protein
MPVAVHAPCHVVAGRAVACGCGAGDRARAVGDRIVPCAICRRRRDLSGARTICRRRRDLVRARVVVVAHQRRSERACERRREPAGRLDVARQRRRERERQASARARLAGGEEVA